MSVVLREAKPIHGKAPFTLYSVFVKSVHTYLLIIKKHTVNSVAFSTQGRANMAPTYQIGFCQEKMAHPNWRI